MSLNDFLASLFHHHFIPIRSKLNTTTVLEESSFNMHDKRVPPWQRLRYNNVLFQENING